MWAALFVGALMWAVHAGVDWDWQMPAATAWVFAAGGLALAAPVERPARKTRPWARFAIGLGCLVLVITPVAVWRSQTQIVKAVHDFERGNCIGAERAALASSAALISRWDPFEVISYCETGAREYSLALRSIAAAEHRDPDNWELRYSEALIRAIAGRDPRPRGQGRARAVSGVSSYACRSIRFQQRRTPRMATLRTFGDAAVAVDEAVAAEPNAGLSRTVSQRPTARRLRRRRELRRGRRGVEGGSRGWSPPGRVGSSGTAARPPQRRQGRPARRAEPRG